MEKMPPDPIPRQRGATAPGTVTIRRVDAPEEYDECVRLQRDTWGSQFTESVPATILRVAQEVGGITAAAFDEGDAMLGFVFGITGVRNGELAHWSDMLAVRAGARDRGLGKKLKAYQRELLLQIGVRTMYWTYDPLVARNANLNLQQLGARVDQYRTNFYGEDTGSVMHAAIGTDRFIVRWALDVTAAPYVVDATWAAAPIVNAGGDTAESAGVGDAHRVRVAIPDDIFVVLDADPALAIQWRESTRQAFMKYLERGYSVTGFLRGSGATPGTYLLER
jgi:predicted GNAT superfamily acetyltransferase